MLDFFEKNALCFDYDKQFFSFACKEEQLI